MRTDDVYTAYINWPGGGKRRPALIVCNHDKSVDIFRITSKYKNKSERIRAYYYPILDWELAGLYKPSYVDTGQIIRLEKSCISFSKVGRLTNKDIKGITNFRNTIKY